MADLKISALTAAGSVDPDDLLASVDVSDTTMNASGTTKKTTRELLQTYNAGTLTTDKKVLDLSATWNAAGVTFTGVKFNVTNTASASGSKVFDFQIGGSSAFVLDKSGNLGLGVTPSAWQSNYVAYQLGGGSSLWSIKSGAQTFLGCNYFFNSSFQRIYLNTGAAAEYVLISGEHRFFTAASGTAGDAFTLTERLRITEPGLLTFGGVTSSFPALKRSSTTLQVRLADDSGDAPFSSGRATIQTLTVGLGGQTAVSNNTVLGYLGLNSASLTGGSNVAVGYLAMAENTSGAANTSVGREALYPNTSGASNSAFGCFALFSNTTASNNSALGRNALYYFNTSNNVAVGYEAVRGSTTVANNTGSNLTGVGYQALLNNTSGSNNVAVGYQSLLSNTTGGGNASLGRSTLQANTTGTSNTAVGNGALYSNTSANNNCAIGLDSLFYFNTSSNVAVGFEALKGGSTTVANNTGANNIGIGYQAGDAITSGSSNIAIGYQVDVDSATGSSQINIGDRYFHDRIRLLERTSDPAKPAEGNMIVWMSDGTGLGDDGDVIIASTAGGVTNYAILFDHSAGTLWS